MSDLKTALILDSRIENLTDVESFGVQSSGQNITFQQYAALSATNSLITFQLQIPSESIVVDRHLLLNATLTYSINIYKKADAAGDYTVDIAVGDNVFNWGQTEAWAPFPFQASLSTMQSTINNCSTSINIGDVLPQLLRMTSKRDLQKYNSTTPAYPDSLWGNYSDAGNNWKAGNATIYSQTASNPLGSVACTSYDENFVPRGAYPTKYMVYQYQANGTDFVSNSPIAENADARFVIVVQANITEPLFLSPFLNCMPHGNQAGFLGLNTLTLNLNVGSLQRVIRTAQSRAVTYSTGKPGIVPLYGWNIVGGSVALPGAPANAFGVNQLFTSTRLLCQFISLNPSQSSKIALRNIVEYTDYPRFITAYNAVNPVNPGTAAADNNKANFYSIVPSAGNISSNNLQLNQIPSRFIIVARIPPSLQNAAMPDIFLPITNISINFNNKSGILASGTQMDLYNLSVKAGSSQSWQEFQGVTTTTLSTTPSSITIVDAALPQTVSLAPTYATYQVPTTGSMLVIESVDLGLEDYLSAGSLGQYNFQCNVTVANYLPYSVQPELCIIVCNEGMFSTIAGSSSIQTGLLTKEMVLRTKEQEPAADSESFRRFVGGVMSNSNMANAAKLLEKHYRNLPPGLAKGLSMGAMGAGSSGGSSSGGRRHLSRHFV